MILGMHRSGTSALAGSLQQAGLYLGDVLSNGFSGNPTGLREPEALIYMHENLLQANGASWHEPPDLPLVWGKLHTAVRDLFIESRRGHAQWGFKEPRTLLVLDGWRQVLKNWTAVGIFRDPVEVARSLQSRNGFDLAKGFALWTQYNRRLLELHKQNSFPLIEYSGDESRMLAGLDLVNRQLGLSPPDETTVYQPKLRNFSRSGESAPPEVENLFRELCERAGHYAP
jgi:hypothetical protein